MRYLHRGKGTLHTLRTGAAREYGTGRFPFGQAMRKRIKKRRRYLLKNKIVFYTISFI
ncbi:MAG TPA: hypothetical protein VFX43_03140 [Chitinophagaceae bacterium]|jgi:hypothetical protein|nr:hypothetical protein [Chitinophagaceae bacterium]